MANWNGLQLTNKGIALQAKVQAGTQLHITKLKLGSGVVPSGTDVKTLTDLIAPEQNLGIGGKEAVGDYCKISSTISNTGLEAGYYVRELGVFAQDPDDGEILYMYTTDGAPDYLPAGGGSTVISQEFSVMIAVDDTDNIVVDIDPAALATMGYVQLQIQEHNTDTTAHANFTGATAEAAGERGMVPAPAAGSANRYLRSDGSWQVPPDTKYSNMKGATSSTAGSSGLVPAPAAGDQNKALFGDATYKQVAQSVNGVAADEEGNIEITLPDFGIDATADEINKTIGAKDNLQNQIDSLEFLIKNFPAWWLNRGNGSDGEFNPDSDTTISSTKNFTSVNIPSGVTVTVAHGARLLCTGAFTNAGTIQVQTVNMAGAGGAGAPDPGKGGTGGQNTNDVVIGLGGNGGAGGSGHRGTSGGAGGAAIGTVKRVVTEESIITTPGGSGAGGGGGASHGGSQYMPGPPGGAGGAGGGSMLITCTEFNNTGTLTANGTNGNNGGGGNGGCGGGGGGGGGAGGTVLVVADTVTSQGTITANGGAGGSGGGGDIGGGAKNGATGGKGANGVVHVVAIKQQGSES